jgi:hypothetical protein
MANVQQLGYSMVKICEQWWNVQWFCLWNDNWNSCWMVFQIFPCTSFSKVNRPLIFHPRMWKLWIITCKFHDLNHHVGMQCGCQNAQYSCLVVHKEIRLLK